MMIKGVHSSQVFRGAAGLILFLISWELVSRSPFANAVLFPGPSTIIPALISNIASGELAQHMVASARRAIAGFFCGAIPAILLGTLTGRSRRWSGYLDPLLQILRSIPPLALVPFGVYWFGIGDLSKIVLVAWAVFFPVWVATEMGIRHVNPLLVRAASSLGAKDVQMLSRVYLPAALPHILTGLKVSLSAGISTLVAAELAGAVFGLGYLIQISQQVFRVDLMFVGLIALGVGNWILVSAMNFAIDRLAPWYAAEARAQRKDS
jgi:ABC-type nitrate/sulfonate/bicarbonate transport system permease component